MEDGDRALALKVQKSAAHYTEAAADEIAILDFVSEQADAVGQDVPVVRLLDTFMHRGPNGKRELWRYACSCCALPHQLLVKLNASQLPMVGRGGCRG